MKSIKPGRGPSMMGGVGSVATGLFGIVWTIGAASMGAPGFFVFFGIIFIGVAIAQAIYNFRNATSENRMSVYDITEDEPDPLNTIYRNKAMRDGETKASSGGYNGKVNFCPNCGQDVSGKTYNYCPGCGQAIN